MEAVVSVPPGVITEDQARTAYRLCSIPLLMQICKENNIDNVSTKTKEELINFMIDNMSRKEIPFPLPEVKELQRRYVVAKGASKNPPLSRKRKQLESGGLRDWSQIVSIPDLITQMDAAIQATPIHELTAEEATTSRRSMWNKYTPWTNMNLLLLGFDSWVLPSIPVYVTGRRPIFVINVGPAGSGKSYILTILTKFRLFRDFNPIVIDPDELNEFFVEVFGYHPPKNDFEPACRPGAAPAAAVASAGDAGADDDDDDDDHDSCCVGIGTGKTGWWTLNREHFTKFERVLNPLPDSDGAATIIKGHRMRPIAHSCCTAKTYNITGHYGKILGNPDVRDHIFKRAINPDDLHHSDIVFDSTGGAMEDVINDYIEHAKRLGYEIVIAGMFSTPENCRIRAERRNGDQHRRMEGFLVERLANNFREDGTIFKWEQYSRVNKCRFVLAENNWLPDKDGGVGRGEAKLIFHRTPDTVEYFDQESVLFKDTGFYGMKYDKDTGFYSMLHATVAEKAKSKYGGSSIKRRISTRRLRGTRIRKTVKKYYRPHTRRRHNRPHSHRRRHS